MTNLKKLIDATVNNWRIEKAVGNGWEYFTIITRTWASKAGYTEDEIKETLKEAAKAGVL